MCIVTVDTNGMVTAHGGAWTWCMPLSLGQPASSAYVALVDLSGEPQGTQGLLESPWQGRHVHEHESLAIATKRVLQ